MPIRKSCLRIYHLIGLVAICGLGAFLARSWQDGRSRDRAISGEEICQSNLNNIAIALANYSEAFGRFPPPFTTDAAGRRAQSWRATILPWFAFDHAMAMHYDRDEPWDGPANARFSSSAPSFYKCPSLENRNSTSYFMINDLSKSDVADLPANAILVVEIIGTNRGWSGPHDDAAYSGGSGPSPGGHPRGVGVILRDFSRLRVKDPSRIKKQGPLYLLLD